MGIFFLFHFFVKEAFYMQASMEIGKIEGSI